MDQVVFPPESLRKLIDKTAQFVASQGPMVQEKIWEAQRLNSKFHFLKPDDIHRPYYEMKVSDFQVSQIEQQQTQPQPEVPVQDPFFVEQPIIAKIDMDIIKLTAQFIAKNGKNFWIGLSDRESKNPQFEFLKPNHALFTYFTKLVQAYSRCLLPRLEDITRLQKLVKERESILQRALDTYRQERNITKQQRPKQEVEEEDRQQMMMIDWHDFVVVETIDFYDEQVLPPPNDKTYVHTLDTGGYVVEAPKQKTEAVYTQKCPKCGEMIPVDDFPGHIRLELLSPRYTEERAKARVSEHQTVYAPDSEVYKNLVKLAKHRPDLVDANAEAPIEQTYSLGGKQDDFIPAKVLNEEEKKKDTNETTGADVSQVIQQLKKNIGKQEPEIEEQREDYNFIDYRQAPEKVNVLAPRFEVQPQMERAPYRLYEDSRNQLVPEEQWANQHAGNKSIHIRVPDEGGDPKWGFNGQVIQLNVQMMQTVQSVKQELSGILGEMPIQKMKLKTHIHSVLKDTETLAKYNLQSGALIDLAVKERGGRRKG